MDRHQAPRRVRPGFTLTELLVVIAIITILATIVTPNLIGFLKKGRVTGAISDIRNAETELNGMLAEVGADSFEDFLTPEARFVLSNFDDYMTAPPTGLTPVEHKALLYDTLFYLLLRLGRDAALEDNIDDGDNTNDLWLLRELFDDLDDVPDGGGGWLNQAFGDRFYFGPFGDPDEVNTVFDLAVINKLRTSYLDLVDDPWGQRYHFWLGPMNRTSVATPVPLRSFRIVMATPSDSYVWDDATRDLELERIIGLPPFDDVPGFPAPHDLNFYIWSNGQNELQDAHNGLIDVVDPGFTGGGDDVNSWDSVKGWESAPRPDV